MDEFKFYFGQRILFKNNKFYFNIQNNDLKGH